MSRRVCGPRPVGAMALESETLDPLLESVSRFVRERLQPIKAHVAAQDRIPNDVVTVAYLGARGLCERGVPAREAGLGVLAG